MNKYKYLTAASLALVLLAACSSGGGLGDVFGGGSSNQARELRGTVDYVDTSTNSVYLTNVSGYTSMLSNSGGSSSVRVYFDNQTTVDYQGQTYRPQDLERGDEVSVTVDQSSGNQLVADRVTVLRDVSNGPTSSGTSSTNVRGTVRFVDTTRNTIEVTHSNGTTELVQFDSSTPVYYSNKTYRVTDLERGDEIDVRVRDYGSGRVIAQDITVTRSISGGTSSGSSSQVSTLRGTVRYVDTSRRTIELESTSWISGFSNNFNGTSGTGGTVFVQYDSNIGVDVNGKISSITGLERGDVIEVQVRSLGGSSYMAERVWLVRDVNR